MTQCPGNRKYRSPSTAGSAATLRQNLQISHPDKEYCQSVGPSAWDLKPESPALEAET